MRESLVFRFYHACFAIFFIILISPACMTLFTGASYTAAVHLVWQNLLHPGTVSFPASHWIREPFFFSSIRSLDLTEQFSVHDAGTPLFPYIWQPYFLSLARFAASVFFGLAVSSALLLLLSRCSAAAKKHLRLFRSIPVTFTTAMLQLFVLYSIVEGPAFDYSSFFCISACSSLILIIETIRSAVPLLYTREALSLSDAYRSVLAVLVPQWRFLATSIWISAALLEYMIQTNGLITFMMQYILLSPTVIAVSLLLLYMPYFLLSLLLHIRGKLQLPAHISRDQNIPIP